LYIVDPQGVRYLKDTLKGVYDVKTIFILPPNEETLKTRLIKR
jgi:guanylate kinase